MHKKFNLIFLSLKKLNLFSYVLKNRNFRHTTYGSNSDDIDNE